MAPISRDEGQKCRCRDRGRRGPVPTPLASPDPPCVPRVPACPAAASSFVSSHIFSEKGQIFTSSAQWSTNSNRTLFWPSSAQAPKLIPPGQGPVQPAV